MQNEPDSTPRSSETNDYHTFEQANNLSQFRNSPTQLIRGDVQNTIIDESTHEADTPDIQNNIRANRIHRDKPASNQSSINMNKVVLSTERNKQARISHNDKINTQPEDGPYYDANHQVDIEDI